MTGKGYNGRKPDAKVSSLRKWVAVATRWLDHAVHKATCRQYKTSAVLTFCSWEPATKTEPILPITRRFGSSPGSNQRREGDYDLVPSAIFNLTALLSKR
jgi:hypothetical protein